MTRILSEEPDHGDPEADIADTVDDESLASGSGVLGICVPEADEGIGAETDPFPPNIEGRVPASTRVSMARRTG
jgi:hypothetical protein